MAELVWHAIYDDETELPQYGEDGEENPFGAIERNKLAEFHMVDRETGEPVFSMTLDDGQRLIYRRRVSMSGNTGEVNWVVYLVGWQQTVNGKNVQSLNWIFPNGRIVNTGKFNEHHPIFYNVVLMPFEEEELG
jgi:hypothetical protein